MNTLILLLIGVTTALGGVALACGLFVLRKPPAPTVRVAVQRQSSAAATASGVDTSALTR